MKVAKKSPPDLVPLVPPPDVKEIWNDVELYPKLVEICPENP